MVNGAPRMAEGPVRVVIADDSAEFLRAASDVVRSVDGFELAGVAETSEDAVATVVSLEPDLVLLDVRMPGGGGIDAARQITELRPSTVVVLISGVVEPGLRERASCCGAVVTLDKRDLRPAVLAELWSSHQPETTPAV